MTLLQWDIKPGGWQRVATDDATGLRFVITRVSTSPKWEVEQPTYASNGPNWRRPQSV